MLVKPELIIVCLTNCLAAISANQFAQECLNAHNYYRGIHQAPLMSLDATVQEFSQSYANYLAANNYFQHSQNRNFGENLYGSWGDLNVHGSTPVEFWYDEVKLYNYSRPVFGMNTGHFTQLVWKKSIKLGCAIAVNEKLNRVYVVANYSPPGNYHGQFEANVLPPLP